MTSAGPRPPGHDPRPSHRTARRWRLVLACLGAAAFSLAWPSGGAGAHAGLDSSTPSSGAALEASPPEIVLDFSEPVDTALGGVQLANAAGDRIDVAEPVQGDDGDPSRIVVADVPELDDGIYVVLWEVTSADGHPARGAFTFQVGTGATGDADALIQAALEGGEASTAVRWAYGAARFAGFTLLSLLVGIGVLGIAVGSRRRPAAGTSTAVIAGDVPEHHDAGSDPLGRRAWGVAWWSTVLLAVVSLAIIALHGAYVTGGRFGDVVDVDLWGDVAGTRLGRCALVRLGLLVLVAVVLWARPAIGRAFAVVFPLLAAGLALTYSMSGHPSASSPAALGVALDTVHLLGVAVWLGGLVGLAVSAAAVDRARVAQRFSTLATVAVPVIVVSGAWQTWHLLGDLSDLTETTWGRLLLVKLSLVVVVVTLGGVSRWLLRQDGEASIRRIVVAEIIVGAVVLGVTAGLVATPPQPPAATQPFSASLIQAGVIADVTLTPGQVGGNELHVILAPPGGTLQQVESAEARIGLPAQDVPPIPIPLTRTGPNHYVGTVQIPDPGDWKLEVIVAPGDNSTLLMSTTVPIP